MGACGGQENCCAGRVLVLAAGTRCPADVRGAVCSTFADEPVAEALWRDLQGGDLAGTVKLPVELVLDLLDRYATRELELPDHTVIAALRLHQDTTHPLTLRPTIITAALRAHAERTIDLPSELVDWLLAEGRDGRLVIPGLDWAEVVNRTRPVPGFQPAAIDVLGLARIVN